MKTPIYDFVTAYRDLRPARFHMPGHKGRGPLGCEELDLTEIPGADSLYEADGIIAQSEANASALFGCPTFYSTEGSSHGIRAMLYLAKAFSLGGRRHPASPASRMPDEGGSDARFCVLAARNVHKAFLTAAALLDLDVMWLSPAGGSYLSAQPSPEDLDAALAETGARAVYLSCPDYLGFLPDLRPLARVCHAHGALLLVDNAHGAYLRFLSPSRHPMDLGADLCCDSAHKTLPVLTGGAYLHVANRMQNATCNMQNKAEGTEEKRILRFAQNDGGAEMCRTVRDALALFGSTSPSYLILQSLDLANPYLEQLPERLAAFLPKVEALKSRLRAAGWTPVGDEPLKLTLSLRAVGAAIGRQPEAEACPNGLALAAALEQQWIFCEFADPDYIVFMLSPQNTDEELARLEAALIKQEHFPPEAGGQRPLLRELPEAVCSIRAAMLAPAETLPAADSLGRVLARPGVSCPPAVPILMPGERIDEAAVAAFARYGIKSVAVLSAVV